MLINTNRLWKERNLVEFEVFMQRFRKGIKKSLMPSNKWERSNCNLVMIPKSKFLHNTQVSTRITMMVKENPIQQWVHIYGIPTCAGL